eukprot:UN26402
MKKLAKEGQTKAVRILAKDYVRMQASRTKFIELKAQLRVLSSSMEIQGAQQQMQTAMTNMSQIMHAISGQINLSELQKSMQPYQMDSEKQELKQEMMNDMMEDAFEVDEDEEDELINQVLDEVGIDFENDMVDAPMKKKNVQKQEETAKDEDLEARLNNLKR